MQTFKSLSRGLCAFLFKFLLLLTALVGTLVMTFRSPTQIKYSLAQSNVYGTLVDGVLKEIDKSNQKAAGQSGDIPLDNPAVRVAVKEVFTPQFLQSSTEQLLDGTYNWLSGKTKLPDFKIDLSDKRTVFANLVASRGAEQLASLPGCTLEQLRTMGPDIDPFAIPCQPPGIDIAAQQQKFASEIINNKDFLPNPVISVQNLPKNEKGKTVFDQLETVPKVYHKLDMSPWVLGGLTAFMGLITLALYDSRRRGLRNIGVALIGIGAFILVATWLSRFVFLKLNTPTGLLGKSIKGSFQQTVIKALDSLSHSLSTNAYRFGGGYVIAGFLILLLLFLYLKLHRPPQKTVRPEPGAEPYKAPEEHFEELVLKKEEPKHPAPPPPVPEAEPVEDKPKIDVRKGRIRPRKTPKL